MTQVLHRLLNDDEYNQVFQVGSHPLANQTQPQSSSFDAHKTLAHIRAQSQLLQWKDVLSYADDIFAYVSWRLNPFFELR